MKRTPSPVLIVFFLSFFPILLMAHSGDYKKVFEQAETFFENENYQSALPLYKQLDSIEPGSENIAFKIGFCYLNSPTYKTKAIPYFEKAITNLTNHYEMGVMSEKAAPLSTYYYLGKAFHLHYEFDKAIEMYQKYIDIIKSDEQAAKEVLDIQHDIETCNNAKELVKNPKTMTVTSLGEGVNSKYADYSPVVSLDEQTLIFTSRREGGFSDAKELNGQYFEDIYVSNFSDGKWQKAVSVGNTINSKGHEATINLSADGQKLLIFKDHGGNGGLYESSSNGSGWNTPELIAAPVNSSAWESHACYTSDNRILYFVSDRTGGYGGRDIYKCLRLPNGDWGPAQNLGPVINTAYDEDGIFVHPDGKQIFFSSKGHRSMGGFDIFTSTINDENGFWSEPENYGSPVNTPDDDVFLITTADGKRAFFSSDKEGGFGEKDIYMISFPEQEPKNVTLLIAKILNQSKESISNNKIFLINNQTKDTLQVLTANSSNGKFGTNLPTGFSYTLVCKINGKLVYNDTLDAPKGQGYQVIRREIPYLGSEAVAQNNSSTKGDCVEAEKDYQTFFKYNKKEIDTKDPNFIALINSLADCIKAKHQIVIDVEASASNVPTRTYRGNNRLAALRAKTGSDKIIKALEKNGIKKDQYSIVTHPLVQGPEYDHDAKQNSRIYENFQYIKIKGIIK